jgi:DNA polymerase-3 subunit delta'
MARRTGQAPEATAAVPAPRANPDLVGHESAERELRRLVEASRLPHAILLSGPRGIGKATLAFRFARFLLANGVASPSAAAESGLAIDPESGVFHRVAAGGHADLLTVERAYDPRRRRLRTEIVVEDAREIAAFFRLTAAEEGWRIVIVDGAEELNRNAANALLKVLEEPPRQALLLLVSHSPGRLLPTIRSRCRHYPLVPLTHDAVTRLLRRYRPDLVQPEAQALALLSGGSVGLALDLAASGGLALYQSILELLLQIPDLDVTRLHAFTDQLARADAEEAYRVAQELLLWLLARIVVRSVRFPSGGEEVVPGEGEAVRRVAAKAASAQWAALREEVRQTFASTDQLNLDRKQAMLGVFFAIEEVAR